jgi:hypothetical protein
MMTENLSNVWERPEKKEVGYASQGPLLCSEMIPLFRPSSHTFVSSFYQGVSLL